MFVYQFVEKEEHKHEAF